MLGFTRPSGLKLFDHFHELGERLRVHLLHCPAPVNLHGIFCSSELTSNLLVEHAGNHHGDHLPLARRQRVEALLQLRYLFLLFAPGTISLQCDANGIQQILVAGWLSKKFDCSSLHRPNSHWNVAVAGDKDYWNTNVSRCKLALKIESTQSR